MAFRTAILYSGSQIGNAAGGLFALAILSLDGTYGIAGWRWLFIVEVGHASEDSEPLLLLRNDRRLTSRAL